MQKEARLKNQQATCFKAARELRLLHSSSDGGMLLFIKFVFVFLTEITTQAKPESAKDAARINNMKIRLCAGNRGRRCLPASDDREYGRERRV